MSKNLKDAKENLETNTRNLWTPKPWRMKGLGPFQSTKKMKVAGSHTTSCLLQLSTNHLKPRPGFWQKTMLPLIVVRWDSHCNRHSTSLRGPGPRWCRKRKLESEDSNPSWLVVSTHLNNFSQIGNLPQIGMNIKNLWNHHPARVSGCFGC